MKKKSHKSYEIHWLVDLEETGDKTTRKLHVCLKNFFTVRLQLHYYIYWITKTKTKTTQKARSKTTKKRDVSMYKYFSIKL